MDIKKLQDEIEEDEGPDNPPSFQWPPDNGNDDGGNNPPGNNGNPPPEGDWWQPSSMDPPDNNMPPLPPPPPPQAESATTVQASRPGNRKNVPSIICSSASPDCYWRYRPETDGRTFPSL